jgi:hypothetical protein
MTQAPFNVKIVERAVFSLEDAGVPPF